MNQTDLARTKRAIHWSFALLVAVTALSCAKHQPPLGSGGTTSSTGTATTGTGATTGAGGSSPCMMDCSKVMTGSPCLKAVCNTGMFPGQVGACVVVPDVGATCDDGKFCTTQDTCDVNGKCVGGPANDCGMTAPPCAKLTCNEASKTCAPANDPTQEGQGCTPVDKCQTGGLCTAGACVGSPKDCSFDPNAECNKVACDSATGNCLVTGPDTTKNGAACQYTGNLCNTGKTCMAGQCQGGAAIDCSAYTHECAVGTCLTTNGMCSSMPMANGMACNGHNACLTGDTCTMGVCSGTPVAGCNTYYTESFETCPGGWALIGDWQCGVPSSVGPPAAESGTRCIGTKIAANYSLGDTFAATTATSPSISLVGTTAPTLEFHAWVDTDTFGDGGNLQITSDGGVTWVPLTTSKAYDSTASGEPVWSGHQSSATGGKLGWQQMIADLTPYVGQSIQLRFDFTSDSFSTPNPGLYIDDIVLAEAAAIPLKITTPSVPDAYSTHPYAAPLARVGGTAAAVWSKAAGGTNDSWITVDPMTGALSGTPAAGNVGAVSLHVHLQEPSVPANFDNKTFNFNVATAIYFQDFEGACPDSWTLTGAWQCGTPTPIMPASNGNAPPTAYSGVHCLATNFGAGYSDNDALAANGAVSPPISLVGAATPSVDFHAWVESEANYDGFDLEVSTNGGATWTKVAGVMPAYFATSGAGGNLWTAYPNQGWQAFHGNLTPYAGQNIKLRFGFFSDGSTHYAGVYLDDVVVH